MAAHKLRIKDIHAGTFSLQERPPHTIATNFGTFTEVRVCGTVASTYINDTQSYGTIVLDDATDTIALKFWRERVPLVQSVQQGEILDVVGTVSEYNEELYLNPLSFYKKDMPAWIAFHLDIASKIKALNASGTWEPVIVERDSSARAESGTTPSPRQGDTQGFSEASGQSYENTEFEEESLIFDDDEITKAVLDAIDDAGVGKEDIITRTGLDDIDVMLSIKELLESGDIFEVDGLYKRL